MNTKTFFILLSIIFTPVLLEKRSLKEETEYINDIKCTVLCTDSGTKLSFLSNLFFSSGDEEANQFLENPFYTINKVQQSDISSFYKDDTNGLQVTCPNKGIYEAEIKFTNKLTNAISMFSGSNCIQIDFVKINTEFIDNLSFMFSNSRSLEKVYAKNFEAQITNMQKMFSLCQNLTYADFSSLTTVNTLDDDDYKYSYSLDTRNNNTRFDFNKFNFSSPKTDYKNPIKIETNFLLIKSDATDPNTSLFKNLKNTQKCEGPIVSQMYLDCLKKDEQCPDSYPFLYHYSSCVEEIAPYENPLEYLCPVGQYMTLDKDSGNYKCEYCPFPCNKCKESNETNEVICLSCKTDEGFLEDVNKEDQKCKCNTEKGFLYEPDKDTNKCLCNSYYGYITQPMNGICYCDKDYGLYKGDDNKCYCDSNLGFYLEKYNPEVGCKCNISQGYLNEPNETDHRCNCNNYLGFVYDYEVEQCVCNELFGLIRSSDKCLCPTSRGYKEEIFNLDEKCKCNPSLGYLEEPVGEKCTCNKNLGYTVDDTDSESEREKCICDINLGIFTDKDTGKCFCDSSLGFTKSEYNEANGGCFCVVNRNLIKEEGENKCVCDYLNNYKDNGEFDCVCKDDYYYVEDEPELHCQNQSSMNGYFLDSKTNVFKKCNESCSSCSGPSSDNDTNCLTCDNSKNYFAIEGLSNTNCIKDPADNGYCYDEEKKIYYVCKSNFGVIFSITLIIVVLLFSFGVLVYILYIRSATALAAQSNSEERSQSMEMSNKSGEIS